MTDQEAEEVLHAVMTVGATRMQVMLAQETAKLGSAAFAAVEVVEQAGAG